MIASYKQLGAQFEYCQVKTHVPTAREHRDLNMNFRSFDYSFKQLSVYVFMKEKFNNIHKRTYTNK